MTDTRSTTMANNYVDATTVSIKSLDETGCPEWGVFPFYGQGIVAGSSFYGSPDRFFIFRFDEWSFLDLTKIINAVRRAGG